MEEFIKMLEEKGYIKTMQNTIDMGFYITHIEPDDYSEVVKIMILRVIEEDKELREAFIDAATDMMVDAVTKQLNFKANQDYKPAELEKTVGKIAVLATIFGGNE